MKRSDVHHLRRQGERGVALIIVLVFVALLSGLLIAFFSRSVTDRQIANSSAAETRSRLLAEGAVDTVLSDLKAEIAAGSNATTVTTGGITTAIYVPSSPAAMVPAQVGATGAVGTENFLKRSARGQAFSTGGASRAANVSSLDGSLNSRVVTPARWNSHLLLEKNSAQNAGDSNDSDFTPVGATSTSWAGAPDWVLVARDGSTQTNWSSGLIAKDSNNSAVVGRYAYQIFEEGGLLDANAAGYPSVSPDSAHASLPGYKANVAFADLTQLPGIRDLSAPRQNNLRDALVGWRNYASTQATNTFPGYGFNAAGVGSFYTLVSNNPKGFLSVMNTSLNGGQSDRLFSSRQELLKLVLGGFASTGTDSASKQERASLQNSLRYLTHFSRALDQPSYVPDPNRPAMVDTTSSAYENPYPDPTNSINPGFLAVRVANTVARGRNDGSDLTAGEPLVKKRFALNRLAWLTYAGPITLDGTSYNPAVASGVITALKSTYGFTDAFLLQGTPANIYKYFGLSWVADSRTTPVGDGQFKWVYNHTGTTLLATLPGSGAPISRLHNVSGREADFFELLKATVACGSKAKAATSPTSSIAATSPDVADNASPVFDANQDNSFDLAIIQMGANIIDQFDLDDLATRILFNDGSLLPKEVRGVENLPYLYRVRYGLVQGRAPVVDPSPSPPDATAKVVIKDTGFNVLYLQPELWNPHDQNNPAQNPNVTGLAPTSFRLVAYSTDPDHVDNSTDNPASGYGGVLCNERMASPNSAPIYYTGYSSPESCDSTTPIAAPFQGAYNTPTAFYTGTTIGAFKMAPSNTALTFTIPASPTGNAFFREPTLLFTPNVPAGSNLAAVKVIPSNHPNILPYLDNSGALTCVTDGQKHLGIYLSTMPANWYVPAKFVPGPTSNAFIPDPTNPTGSTGIGKALAINRNSSGKSNNVLFTKHQSSPTVALTYRLQYQDPTSGKWVSYDEKYASLVPGKSASDETTVSNLINYGSQSPNAYDGLVGRTFSCAYDPRTSRFGMPLVTGPATGTNVDSPLTSTGYGWISAAANQIVTERPDASAGFFNGAALTLPTNKGWNNTSAQLDFGLFTQNNLLFVPNGKRWSADSGTTASNTAQYYADPDGVVRRGMGAYVSGTTTTGLPMATGATTSQTQSRPIVLNRPFRTVGELGYVFSGTPWKNLDFFTAESGDAPLLDVFTINGTDDPTGMVAGRVNLNTRQAPVLQAILAGSGNTPGAYKDEQIAAGTPQTWDAAGLSSAEASSVAGALVARTSSTQPGKGPLTNVAEIISRHGTASTNGTISAKYDNQPFDGFSNDLTNDVNGNAVFGENTPTSNIQRLREAPLRALTAAGQTRVWNLLIDVVAQTGRYPLNASSLRNFVVEGEQHYWVHVAIDRLTGNIIDKQTEVVKE